MFTREMQGSFHIRKPKYINQKTCKIYTVIQLSQMLQANLVNSNMYDLKYLANSLEEML